MSKEIIMPALGMAQETGILLRWLKREGERVIKGEPLMEIETDKVTVEIEAPAGGILCNLTAAEGDEVPVGQVIGRIDAPDEVGKPPATPQTPATRPAKAQKASPVAARIAREHGVDLHEVPSSHSRITKADVRKYLDDGPPTPAPAPSQRLPASPKARRLARENRIEAGDITATGPGGAMLAADVLAAIARREETAADQQYAPAPAPAPFSPAAETQPLDLPRGWSTMARRMVDSWHGAPHFFVLREVDATRLQQWRSAAQAGATEKITYSDLLIKTTAVALRKHPRLNARRQDDAIILNRAINICLVVATDDGLIAPVIHAADSLTVSEIAARRRDLVDKARAGRLQPSDVAGGTFTISNLGMYNVDAFTAIINPPQAAILAVGRLADRVVPIDGMPVVRPQMTMTLSCDHRITDGAGAAAFLNDLTELIQEPLGMIN